MKNGICLLLLAFLFLPLLLSGQVKLIYDTDFGGDADDLGALAMLHQFVDRGECRPLHYGHCRPGHSFSVDVDHSF